MVGSHKPLVGTGGCVWDASRGDDCEDPPVIFSSEEADQGDQPRVEGFAAGGSEGDPVGGDGVSHAKRSVQPMPKLGAWREQLDGLLAGNEAKPARERLTLMRVFESLRDLGFDGGY